MDKFQETLEALARTHVGDHDSPLAFVTEGGRVIGVFVGPSRDAVGRKCFIEGVCEYAASFGEDSPIMVEDCSGTVWENRMALRIHNEDDPDYEVESAYDLPVSP